jgi:hypothetical protein
LRLRRSRNRPFLFAEFVQSYPTVSNHNPFHLIQAHLIQAAIVKLGRARRRMVRHRRGLFERAAVLEISGDAGCPEAVIAEFGCNAGGRRAT